MATSLLPGAFITLFCVCFVPNGALGANITVNATGDGETAIICAVPDFPGCTLRGAIARAHSTLESDTIDFNIPANDPFCTSGVCTINLASPLPAIVVSIAILGPGADKLIIRNGPNVTGPIFVVNAQTGINQFVDLTISNGNNSQTGGGGLVVNTGFSSTTVFVTRCVISGNSASQGGGIFNNAEMFIRESLITGNTGGGIFNVGATMSITNSTITGNTGIGVHNSSGTINLTNSTVSSNAGINSNGLTNSVGGAVFNVKSSIIARNSGALFSDISGAFVSAGFNLIGKRDGGTGFNSATDLSGTIDTPLDPKFDPSGLQNNGGTTKTIALLPNSPAIDQGSTTGLTGNLTIDQRGFPRRRDNPLIVNAAGGTGADIGAYERHTYSTFDFEGDGRTDVGIFRPNGGEWWINRSLTGQTLALQFGASTDTIAPADFTGDGKTDIAFWRSSTGQWFVLRSEDFSFFAFGFGTAGDVPVPGDFDGDRKADAAVFRPATGTWFILKSTGPISIEAFGINGDVPVVGDYDGDGRADIAIFRPSNGQWWLKQSTAGIIAYTFGTATDKVVPADYTGDNKTDVAFWRPSNGNWLVLRSENSTFYGFAFGINGDVPAPGDYDGDGKADATVFRPSSGLWFSQRSLGGFAIQQFGLNGDRPIPNAFVP